MAALVTNLPPAPTFADPVLTDNTKRPGDNGYSRFNPIWLKWFLDIVAYMQALAGGTVNHNSLQGLQGGSANQFYHITAAQDSALGGNIVTINGSGIILGGSATITANTPNTLTIGGTATFNGATAVNLNGLSGTTTVALAKLTSGGANGSMTVVNGIVTACSAPT